MGYDSLSKVRRRLFARLAARKVPQKSLERLRLSSAASGCLIRKLHAPRAAERRSSNLGNVKGRREATAVRANRFFSRWENRAGRGGGGGGRRAQIQHSRCHRPGSLFPDKSMCVLQLPQPPLPESRVSGRCADRPS